MELLHKTGTKKCEEWLKLLEDTEVNTTALGLIANHITNDSNRYERVTVWDTTASSATALLPLIPCKEVMIVLYRRPRQISQLVQATAKHTLTRLYLYHHYKNPDLGAASDPILRDLPR